MGYLLVVASYFLGAIPFGLLIGKLAGKDVRQEGSRNIGATNVSRLLGKKLGFATLICDGLKGFAPMWLAAHLQAGQPNAELVVACCGIAAIVGHMFPIYLGFVGGKGVATGLGVFLFLSPVAVLASLIVFVGAVWASGYVSVGSLLASALMVVWLWLLAQPTVTLVTAAIVAILIWLKHHENIGRLVRGEEKSWKKKS
ncbi:MAG: glycerol-3-phosphate 1-O-acyltransferase PlsY [Desulfopila sp.]